jgi:hypothetical protein
VKPSAQASLEPDLPGKAHDTKYDKYNGEERGNHHQKPFYNISAHLLIPSYECLVTFSFSLESKDRFKAQII